MKDIFIILSEVDFIKSKEDKIKKIFINYNLNPDKYFFIPDFYD